MKIVAMLTVRHARKCGQMTHRKPKSFGRANIDALDGIAEFLRDESDDFFAIDAV